MQQPVMFSHVALEHWVPKDHPIRKLRTLVDMIRGGLDAVFASRYPADERDGAGR